MHTTLLNREQTAVVEVNNNRDPAIYLVFCQTYIYRLRSGCSRHLSAFARSSYGIFNHPP
jgi:hypothetical protein